MIPLLIFLSGAVTGFFVRYEDNKYRDYKMEFLKEAAGVEPPEGMYLQEDPFGDIWVIAPGSCTQVF
jgi:hypothetical protein